MRLNAYVKKADELYAINIPSLEIYTQAKTKEEIPEMIKDAVQTAVDTHIEVELFDEENINFVKDCEFLYHVIGIESKLIDFIVKQKRIKEIDALRK